MISRFKLLLLFSLSLSCLVVYSQEIQKNFINYQGVARDAEGEVMADETINIQIAIKFGAPDIPASYIENHEVETDQNGVFRLLIGNGTQVTGDYGDLSWGGIASYLTISLNGTELGTSEIMAVPYAITSGDNRWYANENNIRNLNGGNVGIGRNPEAKLDVDGDFRIEDGPAVSEISTDGNLSGNSDSAIPTERAIKTYVDNATADETPVVFKVRGFGFAVKNLNAGTIVETDFWDTKAFDTRNAFNLTTKRYVVPETGYYYLHAVVKQSNGVTSAFFRISFNIDTGNDYGTVVDGDDVRTEVSGIYFLNEGQEVYVNLRNFSSTINVRVDGYFSWFEGYKIR